MFNEFHYTQNFGKLGLCSCPGTFPIALTTFPILNSGNNYNDLANKSLKILPNLKQSIRIWSDFAPKLIRENRSKLLQKSIKVSSKYLVDFSEGDRLCP
ncbi:MAG: hypothetical protein CBC14_009245 [Alphaproteobacteria bacterium TMED54]|nr:MAG: hypothetical protein CBC14_009245 [Alphaproteobacteria bacterium TMED54]